MGDRSNAPRTIRPAALGSRQDANHADVDVTTRSHSSLTRVPAWDGLRGLAVLGVLLFHSELGFARGGYLGVSAFFTLSGFLITSLLLAEHRRGGRIGLRGFWARRARRLLPAAFVALAGLVLFGATVATPDQVRSLRGDVLAALGYVANWRFYATGQSYTHVFSAPSPALHFWSLAIEEQFYVVFPLVFAGVLWLGRGRIRVLGGLLAAGAIGAVWWSHTLVATHDVSRCTSAPTPASPRSWWARSSPSCSPGDRCRAARLRGGSGCECSMRVLSLRSP